MRTVRILVWTLVGLTVLATCSCKEPLAPTIKRATEDGSTGPEPPIQPAEREAALKVIDRALQAHGGEAALARAGNLERDASGELTSNPSTPFTDHTVYALPDRARMQIEVGSEKRKELWIVNGEQAWQVAGSNSQEMPRARVQELAEDLYLIWLTTLAPLKGNTVQLGTTPEINIDGHPAVGVRVVAVNRPDVRLYFDKETGLLVMAERQASEGGISSVKKEHFFSLHKDFDGVKLPTRERLVMAGNEILKVDYTSWKVLTKADEALFHKP